jgi:hypothetical protein
MPGRWRSASEAVVAPGSALGFYSCMCFRAVTIGMAAHEVAARGRAQPQTVELTKIIIEFESPPPK